MINKFGKLNLQSPVNTSEVLEENMPFRKMKNATAAAVENSVETATTIQRSHWAATTPLSFWFMQ
jgi:hypothetical protein